jgi:large conductance mechanosensitive channel
MWHEFRQFALRRSGDVRTGTADKPAEIPVDVKLLTEIRDLMKTGRTL